MVAPLVGDGFDGVYGKEFVTYTSNIVSFQEGPSVTFTVIE